MTNAEKELFNHFLQYKIPIPWCKRMDDFRPSSNKLTKYPWDMWRRMEARRSQNAAFNACLNRTEVLAGMWSKLYH